MQFKTQAVVTGVKYFQGNIDGTNYDKTTVYINTDLDDRSGTAKGQATMPYEWGTSAEFHKVKNLSFPLSAEVTMESITNGKTQKMIVVDIRPLPVPQKA